MSTGSGVPPGAAGSAGDAKRRPGPSASGGRSARGQPGVQHLDLPAEHHADQVAAGTVVLVTGQATASDVDTMEMRSLQKGDAVFAGEIVSAGPNTYVNLKFSDGGLVLVRPNSRFQIVEGTIAQIREGTTTPHTEPSIPVPVSGPVPVASVRWR